jgi:DNA-directed RNA polymerase specialized sigma24 family protein
LDRKQARAFEAFVSESGDALLRMAALLTSDPRIAEDVYQETLHRLARRWPEVDNPWAFCRRVMHNIVIDQARARQRRPRELGLSQTFDSGDPRSGDAAAATVPYDAASHTGGGYYRDLYQSITYTNTIPANPYRG